MYRSGTEEQFTELAQMLEDIQTYQRDFEEKKECERRLAQDKRIEEKLEERVKKSARLQCNDCQVCSQIIIILLVVITFILQGREVIQVTLPHQI